MTSPRWDKDANINPRVTNAGPPAANETCPVCDRDIPEGSAWVINDKDQRIHRICRVAAAVVAPEPELVYAPTDHLALARTALDTASQGGPYSQGVGAVVSALASIIAHLEQSK